MSMAQFARNILAPLAIVTGIYAGYAAAQPDIGKCEDIIRRNRLIEASRSPEGLAKIADAIIEILKKEGIPYDEAAVKRSIRQDFSSLELEAVPEYCLSLYKPAGL